MVRHPYNKDPKRDPILENYPYGFILVLQHPHCMEPLEVVRFVLEWNRGVTYWMLRVEPHRDREPILFEKTPDLHISASGRECHHTSKEGKAPHSDTENH